MTALPTSAVIGVVGAGTMGAGIAQVAAAAGHPVRLYDAFPGAAEKGRARIAADLNRLASRGKIDPVDASAIVERIVAVDDIAGLADAALVVEAIVEDLAVKRGLIAALEAVVADDAILATNTSSISITAVAREATHPGRVVGMHFFNPAPVMKLVEVVSGVATNPAVATAVFDTARGWGKVAVRARSTPGFIVNRVARGFYGEALRLYEEQVADPATIDAILTEGAGFRMGPFALMDLIGHDVNYAVSQSVFDAFSGEPRFRPSIAQRELVDAGRLGRKSGHGFYDYSAGAVQPSPATEPVAAGPTTIPADIDIVSSDGRTAAMIAKHSGRPTIVCDIVVAQSALRRVAFATSADVSADAVAGFVASLAARNVAATRLPDWPGLIATRTLASIANEGFEAVMQGVADEAAVDDAMRFGVNYPRGPIGWAREVGLERILSVLDQLHSQTGDPRYRASLGLRRAAEA